MGRNGWIIFITKIVRTFCYGSLGVLLPVYLAEQGMPAQSLGLAFAAMLLASAAMTFLIRRPAERFVPRRVIIALAGLIVMSAGMLVAFHSPWPVVLAAMIGNVAVSAGETGPFLSLEQVLLSRTTEKDRLTSVMSFYNLVGYMAAALGAAAVGQGLFSPRAFFQIFLMSGLVQIFVYTWLSKETPAGDPARDSVHPPSGPFVRRIAALFALDSFAGGFVIQSFVVYWFYLRFHLDVGTLGWIFSAAQFVTGLSFIMAPPLSRRFGLVETMVFSHLISNVLLISIGFATGPSVAIGFLLCRHLLSQIDVPTRQTFLMLAVEDHERESAAILTNTSRTMAQAVSPMFSGWIVHASSLSVPFVLGGVLKIIYDLSLYSMIRKHGLLVAAKKA